MDQKAYKCLTISDFNLDNFAGYLSNDVTNPKSEVTVSPFGQVIQMLMGDNLQFWKGNPDFAVVWTQPESVIESFRKMINFQTVSVDTVLKEVDEYASLVKRIMNKVAFAFVPSWVLPTYYKSMGLLELKNEVGIVNTLMRMNLRLSENFYNTPNIYMLNAQRWIELSGKQAFNPKLWYMAKVPFGNGVFKEAVKDIKSALQGLNGNSKKLIILDLDDTLWGGIVGDVGWTNLTLGGHDPIGEAFVDFQTTVKSLTNRGILLGIVSKNEESIALEAIKNHPEMVLRIEDFAGWKINWQDKAKNVVELVSELNLGIQSVVFIDDNPVERARVRESLSEVLVPEWPEDKMLYRRALLGLSCFNTPSVSQEDLKRTTMYVAERKRTALKNNLSSLEDWLNTLGICVKIAGLSDTNLPRTTQLLNKTNQMNLITRRMTEQELANWVKEDNHHLWTFRVSDKFGDSGLTGIISLEIKNREAKIVDFVLSCRVMGRKIEETMLATAIDFAKSKNIDEVIAVYMQTAKNKPCLEFWKQSGFSLNSTGNTFIWKTDKRYPYPKQVEIKDESLSQIERC